MQSRHEKHTHIYTQTENHFLNVYQTLKNKTESTYKPKLNNMVPHHGHSSMAGWSKRNEIDIKSEFFLPHP